MAGHSKFSNIKAKKEKNDSAKGKIFTRIGKEILIAVKEGGPDVNNNSKLRQIVAKAKANNMPNDNIERSIKKAASSSEADLESIVYEGYGPSGVAVIVDTLTDNKNRTAANVRSAFTKGQGNIGTPGCVSFMFDTNGQLIIDKEECEMDPDELMMMALDAGAEDFSDEEDSFEIITDPAEIKEVEERAIVFLRDVFASMNLGEVEITSKYNTNDGCLEVAFEGEDMGILIGKRGQTLDSLQYLTSLVVNKGESTYIRVKLDTEDYRRRRKETLENLARGIAYKVKKTRKPVVLEPMNPYERRIIHSALQGNKYVETVSEGEEPYRHVVVKLKRW